MVRRHFPTLIYSAPLQSSGLDRLNQDLADEIRKLRAYDAAGRRWSKVHYPGGYTSYASLNHLPRFSSTFASLEKKLLRHAKSFARALEWDLQGQSLRMTDCWANIMPRAAAHSSHLHPLAVISGTYYVLTPPAAPGLKFEDPRLDRFMAAPPRRTGASPSHRAHLTYPARAGTVLLFESWLRHEVPPNQGESERISVSFNFNLAA